MDPLGWIVIVILVLLFGKNFTVNFGVSNATAIPTGTFDNTNAVPTVMDNVPAMTIQNQNNLNTHTAPAPWKKFCGNQVSTQIQQAQPVTRTELRSPLTTSSPVAHSVMGTLGALPIKMK